VRRRSRSRTWSWLGLSIILAGCGQGADDSLPPLEPEPGATAQDGAAGTTDPAAGGPESDLLTTNDSDPAAILRSVVQMLRTSHTRPGGDDFNIAKDYLNHFFAAANKNDFRLTDASRAYLTERLGPNAAKAVADLEVPTFTFRDSRHIEDCLLLHAVAARVAGDGEDLERVRRIFDWTIQQVELVPPGSLGMPGSNVPQARARPYDVMTRGMATETGAWAERSWIFMALCRQLGIDAGLVLYRPPARSAVLASDKPDEPTKPRDPVVWVVAALIDGKPYLFDARIGLPIPGPDGRGIATLEEAVSNPDVLGQLELPGRPYSTTQADLAAGKLTIWIDSTLGLLTPRMRQLQLNLAGRDRMVLFRDPAEQDTAFARALGGRFAKTDLWPMPIEVESLLFSDPTFVDSTKFAIQFFDPSLPLLPARLAQFRGEVSRAIESYSGFRFAENPVMNNGKDPIPRGIQHVLDLYATYMLGLAKLDQGEPGQAEFFFKETLRMFPDPPPNPLYVYMFRLGAMTNLGLINEARGNRVEAIRYLSQAQPTPQEHGNLLRARALIWSDPFVPEPTPPAPPASQARLGR
jgi:hypothetical protein